MRDVQVRGWVGGLHFSAGLFESVRDLNHRFLDLVARRPSGWNSAGPGWACEVSARVAPLSDAQKAAASNCPYVLFDLRFHDDGYWLRRLRNADSWSVADELSVFPDRLEFVRLALFFAWHVASTDRLAAQLLIGMHEETAAAFRSTTIDHLPSLAASEAAHLSARWNGCVGYWSALTGAAARRDPGQLRRIQLYGLQLAAAARLSS